MSICSYIKNNYIILLPKTIIDRPPPPPQICASWNPLYYNWSYNVYGICARAISNWFSFVYHGNNGNNGNTIIPCYPMRIRQKYQLQNIITSAFDWTVCAEFRMRPIDFFRSPRRHLWSVLRRCEVRLSVSTIIIIVYRPDGIILLLVVIMTGVTFTLLLPVQKQ